MLLIMIYYIVLLSRLQFVLSFIFNSPYMLESSMKFNKCMKIYNNHILHATSPRYDFNVNETAIKLYEKIDGIQYSSNDDDKLQSINANNIIYVNPSDLKGSSAEKTWAYYEARKEVESILEEAIMSDKLDIRDYFDSLKPFLAIEKSEILQAHEDFYRAWNERDFDLMASLWYPGDEKEGVICKTCRDPSLLTGYDHIMKYWSQIFDNLETSKSARSIWKTSEVELDFQGDLALVTCICEEISLINTKKINKDSSSSINTSDSSRKDEDINSKNKDKSLRKARTTNIFMRPYWSDRYMLLSHISTLTPDSLSSKVRKQLRTSYRDPIADKKKNGRDRGGMSLSQILGGGGVGMNIISTGVDDDDDDDDDIDEEWTLESTEFIDENENDDGVSDDNANDLKGLLQQRIRDTLKKAMLNNGGETPRSGMIVIGSDGSTFSSINKDGESEDDDEVDGNNESDGQDDMGRRLLKAIVASRDDGGDEGTLSLADLDDDGEDEDDASKELAMKTLNCIRWLYDNERLTKEEKRILTNDIVLAVGQDRFSRAEVAFGLLIAGSRPKDLTQEIITSLPQDPSLINYNDMEEFHETCRSIASDLGNEKHNQSPTIDSKE